MKLPARFLAAVVLAAGVMPGIAVAGAAAVGISDCVYQWSRTYSGTPIGDERALGVATDHLGNTFVVGYTATQYTTEGNNWFIRKYFATGNVAFSRTYNFMPAVPGPTDDRATCVAVDPSGSFYVGGFIDRFSEGTNMDWMLRKYAGNGDILWSRTHSCQFNGGTGFDDDEDRCLGVAVDVSGSVIAVGHEMNKFDGFSNLLVKKYDAEGNLLWTASHNGSSAAEDVATCVATDAAGNIIVGGYETFGPFYDALILKYDSSGECKWKDLWDSAASRNDALLGVGVDALGDIYAGGYTNDWSDDWLLMKYSSAGARQWVRTYDGPRGGDDRVCGMAVLPDGSFVAGGFTGRPDLGQGHNWRWEKRDTNGNPVWTDTYDSPAHDDDEIRGVAYDALARLAVAGFETRTDLGGYGEQWRVTRFNNVFCCPTAMLVPSKANPDPGEEFTLTLSVTNGGEDMWLAVVPTCSAVSGAAAVSLVSGPTPAYSLVVNGYSQAAFVWTWRMLDAGTVVFSASATGTYSTRATASCGVTSAPRAPIPQVIAGTMGRDFWMAFMLDDLAPTADEYSVLVAGPAGTNVTVDTPWAGTPVTLTLPASGSTRFQVRDDAGIGSEGAVENRGVHVTSTADVAVYGFDCHSCLKDELNWSSDGTMVIPTAAWGCEYLALGYARGTAHTQMVVVASRNGTNVTITPAATVPGHPAGIPFIVPLNAGEAYRLSLNAGANDLAGTIVTADLPVAVFGGANKTGVPEDGTADGSHLYEQMLPTKYWGTRFITVPMAGRQWGDTFMMVAALDGTGVSVSGAAPFVLDRGDTREMIITSPSEITSTKPVMVAQYANNHVYDNRMGDPAMALVPAVDQYVSDALLPATSSTLFSSDFVNITIPSSGSGSIKVDGLAVSATCFTAVGLSGFSGGALWVAPGRHRVTSSAPFGLLAYGYFLSGTFADAYAWSGPLALASRNRLILEGPSSVERWQTANFTINYMNREVHSADFTIWDTLPAGTTLGTVSPGGTVYGGTLAWTVNGVPAGGSGSVFFNVRVIAATGSLSQKASATYLSAAVPCPVTVYSNALSVPASAPAASPVKVYPNPFNPRKAVNGAVKFRGMRVGGKIRVYTVSGRLVWDAIAGVDPVEWNGKNKAGENAAPGVYLWVAEGEQGKERGKIFLQR